MTSAVFSGDSPHDTELAAIRDAGHQYRVPDKAKADKIMRSRKFLKGVSDTKKALKDFDKLLADKRQDEKPKADYKKTTLTDKSVRDLPQQIVLQGDTIKVISKVGRKKAGEYSFSVAEWEAAKKGPSANAEYNLRELISKKFRESGNLTTTPEGESITERIIDAQVSGIKKAFEKHGPAEDETVYSTRAPATTKKPKGWARALRKWFGRSKVVGKDKKPLMVFSGHGNIAMWGDRYNPKKSTAGGFYATEDPEIAGSYAMGKFGEKEYFENGDEYVLASPATGKMNKKVRLYELTGEQIEKIDELKNAKDENGDPASEISEMDRYIENMKDYDKDVRRWSYTGGSHNLFNIWQFYDMMGHTIAYDKQGDLSPIEKQQKNSFEELLDELGVKWNSHYWRQPGILPLYLKIENPIDTSKPFPKDLMAALEKKAKRERVVDDAYSLKWTNEYPLKNWVQDIKDGDEFWSTHVPAKALPIIQDMGYDGIKDTGGKGGGDSHTVWIAFGPTQIKSAIGNRGTFDPEDARIAYSTRKTSPFDGVSLADVQKLFPGQHVGLSPDGSIWVRTKSGHGVSIRNVTEIKDGRARADIFAGQMKKDGTIYGSYVRNKIKISAVGNKWSLAHEITHWLEDTGQLNKRDIRVLQNHIKKLHAKGNWKTENLEDVGGKEDRAVFIQEMLPKREQIKNTPAGRVLQKLWDFLQKLGELVGMRTATGITADIESGKVFGKKGKKAEGTETQYSKTTETIPFAEKWYSQMEKVLTDKLPGKGSPAQIKQMVNSWAKKGMLKQEELDWSGLNEWLDERHNPADTVKDLQGQLKDKRFAAEQFTKENHKPIPVKRRTPEQVEAQRKRILEKLEGEISGLEQQIEDAKKEKGKVTKAEVLEYLKQNNVRVEEVVLGEGAVDEGVIRDTARLYIGEAITTQAKNDKEKELGLELLEEWHDNPDDAVKEGNLENYLEGYLGTDIFDYIDDAKEDIYGEEATTKFKEYQLPGGKNYKELLLTLPIDKYFSFDEYLKAYRKRFPKSDSTDSEVRKFFEQGARLNIQPLKESYNTPHWDHPNVIAHIRFSEREAGGKKVLHVEEIQSDWISDIRKKGIERTTYNITHKTEEGLQSKEFKTRKEAEKFLPTVEASTAGIREITTGSVPPAPWTKTYYLKAMQRMVRYASENGFDAIAWNPGKVHTDRWGSESIVWKKSKDGWFVKVKEQVGGETAGIDIETEADIRGMNFTAAKEVKSQEDLKELIREIAKREEGSFAAANFETMLDARTKKTWDRMQKEDIGSSFPRKEGFENIYDEKIPNMIKKFFGKKAWGSPSVGEIEIEKSGISTDMSIEEEGGSWVVKDDAGEFVGEFDTRNEAEEYIKEEAGFYREDVQKVKLHSLPITPEMQEKSLIEGMPQYSTKKTQPDIFEGKEFKKMPLAEPPPKTTIFEKLKFDWFGNKDWTIFRNSVEASNIQKSIQKALGAKRMTKAVKDMDQALHIHMDLKRNPEHYKEFYEDLNDEQKKITDLALTIPNNPELVKIADYMEAEYTKLGQKALSAGVIFNAIENYVGRVWDLKDKRGPASDTVAKFKQTSRHSKQRVFETILEGMAKGYELKVKGASNSMNMVKDEIDRTVEDRRLVRAMRNNEYMADPELTPEEILEGKKSKYRLAATTQYEGYEPLEHPNMTNWENIGQVKGKSGLTYVGKDGKEYARGKDIRVQTQYAVYKEGAKRASRVLDSKQDAEDWMTSKDDQFEIREREILWQRQKLYAPEEIATRLNKILGTSRLKGVWKIGDVSVMDALTKWNAIAKATILMTSFFHHLAFIRSYWLGTRKKTMKEWNLAAAYREGQKAIHEMGPDIELLVRNGLTLSRMQDWEEDLLRSDSTALGKKMDEIGGIPKKIKDKINDLRERQADFLFKKMGSNLKAKTALIELRNARAEHPELSDDKMAEYVANLVNDDFGGLHLQRKERDPTVQHIFRLFALAPDWTESNINSMVKMLKAGGKAEKEIYRRMWAGILAKGMAATILANLLMAIGDDEDAMERFRKAWNEGHFRWLDVDITPIYKVLGGKTEARKYFPVFGHFKDPMKFVRYPIRSAHHKGSVLYRYFFEALSGQDWRGHSFTTLPEILGVDDKGEYATDKKGFYKAGDPKGGKDIARLTKYGGKRGPISPEQVPSFLMAQIKQTTPVQVQQLIGMATGETDAFDGISRSLGLNTGSTYPNPKKQRLEWVDEYVKAIEAKEPLSDLRKKVREYNNMQKIQEEDPITWGSIKTKAVKQIKLNRAKRR